MRQQAEVLASAAYQTYQAMAGLRSFSGLDQYWVEINRLENEGDRVYRKTVARLYSGDFKAMDVLKWKDLVDQMEEALDGCEDIANTIESMTLKDASMPAVVPVILVSLAFDFFSGFHAA